MSKIGKNDLIREIATAHGQKQDVVRATLDAALDAIKAHIEAGDTVQLQGFGTFSLKTRAARTGRNPHTGEALEIAESSAMAFKPSKPRAA